MIEIEVARPFRVPVYTAYCVDCKCYVKSNVGQYSWLNRNQVIHNAKRHLKSEHSAQTLTTKSKRIQRNQKLREIA